MPARWQANATLHEWDKPDACAFAALALDLTPALAEGQPLERYIAEILDEHRLGVGRRLDGRRAELTRQLKERTGDERREATRELAELLLDLGKLKLGWAQAHPIIDLHLQKFGAN